MKESPWGEEAIWIWNKCFDIWTYAQYRCKNSLQQVRYNLGSWKPIGGTFFECLQAWWNVWGQLGFDLSTFSFCTNVNTTGDPRISWFQNSWSPLFRDLVSGIISWIPRYFVIFKKKIWKNWKKKIEIFFHHFSRNWDAFFVIVYLPQSKY